MTKRWTATVTLLLMIYIKTLQNYHFLQLCNRNTATVPAGDLKIHSQTCFILTLNCWWKAFIGAVMSQKCCLWWFRSKNRTFGSAFYQACFSCSLKCHEVVDLGETKQVEHQMLLLMHQKCIFSRILWNLWLAHEREKQDFRKKFELH